MNQRCLLILILAAGKLFAAPMAPRDWVNLPDDQNEPTLSHTDESPTSELESGVDRIFNAQSKALGHISIPENRISLLGDPKTRPSDWMPWHLHYVTTDLAVSVQGLIGALVIRGTPFLQAYWMKQGTAPVPPTMSPHESTSRTQIASSSSPVAVIEAEAGNMAFVDQLEPAIKAVMASGKVKNEGLLRKELRRVAEEFQKLVDGLDATANGGWWVSAFRLDLEVDVSGHVGPSPFVVGGDLRVRLDWRRIQKDTAQHRAPPPPNQIRWLESFRKFVIAREEDLAELSDAMTQEGYEPYSFRMAIGMTAHGDFGAVRGMAGVMGHLFFMRDNTRPPIYPTTPKILSKKLPEMDPTKDFVMIERNPSWKHLAYAKLTGIKHEVQIENGVKTAVYRTPRERFRKGLRKVAKIGKFFSKIGAKPHQEGWKVYELRMGFELSIGAEFGIAGVAVTPTVEALYWNKNF